MPKRRFVPEHAALRLAQRYEEADLIELRRKVADGDFEYVRRQTHTRSICRTLLSSGPVWFVLNRKTGAVVTVLTESQAADNI